MSDRKHKLQLVEWKKRPHCLYLNDYRIAGGKPWGGGSVIKTWLVDEKDLREAMSNLDVNGAQTSEK